jgi:hypothetical protein
VLSHPQLDEPLKFAVLGHNSPNTFAGGHVKRLRPGFGFIFGNDSVDFRDVDGLWIVFEQSCVCVR